MRESITGWRKRRIAEEEAKLTKLNAEIWASNASFNALVDASIAEAREWAAEALELGHAELAEKFERQIEELEVLRRG